MHIEFFTHTLREILFNAESLEDARDMCLNALPEERPDDWYYDFTMMKTADQETLNDVLVHPCLGAQPYGSRIDLRIETIGGSMDGEIKFLRRLVDDTQSRIQHLVLRQFRIFKYDSHDEPTECTDDQIKMLRRHVAELEAEIKRLTDHKG